MREAELARYYLDVLVTMLSTPLGVLALVGLLCMIAASVSIKESRWVFLTLAGYVSTLPLIDAEHRYFALAFGLEQLRQFARPLIYLSLCLLLPALLTSDRGWRRQLLPWALILFFAFEVSISLRFLVFGNPFRGIVGIASYVLMLMTLGLAVSRWLQTMEDLYKLLWSINCVGLLVILGTCYQLVVNRTPIIYGSRLAGVTSNPQYLGIVIAYTLPFTCHLLMYNQGRQWARLVLIAQLVVTIALLLWTGSRTGGLSAACALAVVFHRRLGRLLIIGGIVFGLVLLVLPYFEGSGEIASRLLSTEDTRSGVFRNLFRILGENLWFGAAREMFEGQESSYLAILGQFGIIGALPFLAAVVAFLVQLYRLWSLRRFLGNERGLVDLMGGIWAAVAITSALEVLLLGVITYMVLMIYMYLVITCFLLDWCRVAQEATAREYEPDALMAAA